MLQIYYKCEELQKLRHTEIETEVTKMGIKRRYEKMRQGDEVEKMSDDKIAEALKELEVEKGRKRVERQFLKKGEVDITRIRPTELKHNIRWMSTSEATKKREAAILLQEEAVT